MSSRIDGSHHGWDQHRTLVAWFNDVAPTHLSKVRHALGLLLRPRPGFSDEYMRLLREAVAQLQPRDFLVARTHLRLWSRVEDEGPPVTHVIRSGSFAGAPKIIDSSDARNVAVLLVLSAIEARAHYLEMRRHLHQMLPPEHSCQLPETVTGDPMVAYSKTRECRFALRGPTRCMSPDECSKYGCPLRIGGPLGSSSENARNR
jgi:hypothetical protein